MKEYHTTIKIGKSIEEVWRGLTDFKTYPNWNPLVGELTGNFEEGGSVKAYIIPLGKSFSAKISSFKKDKELIWQGTLGASFLLKAEHYYKIKSIDEQHTELLHGEYFTGVFSHFIPKFLLQKMENAFTAHNEALKKRIENEG